MVLKVLLILLWVLKCVWKNYEITAGEEAGYADFGYDVLDGPNAGASAAVGCQCLPGLAPANEQDRDRDAFSLYAEMGGNLTEDLSLDVALRTENYSDFWFNY